MNTSGTPIGYTKTFEFEGASRIVILVGFVYLRFESKISTAFDIRLNLRLVSDEDHDQCVGAHFAVVKVVDLRPAVFAVSKILLFHGDSCRFVMRDDSTFRLVSSSFMYEISEVCFIHV